MSLFEQGETKETVSQLGALVRPSNGAPRQPTMGDRILSLEERIGPLERQNKDLRQGVEHLCKLLVEQVGLVI